MNRFALLLEHALTLLEEEKHKYSSTQFNIGGDLAKRIIAYGQKIPDDILAEKGLESVIHITIKYGIETSDAEEVEEILDNVKQFEITLGKVSCFPVDESHPKEGEEPFDVLKIDVSGSYLHKVNRLISSKLKCTDTHPSYKPHLTIAYLKPGEAEQFVGDDDFEGEIVVVDEIVFSNQEDEKSTIKLVE